MRRWARDCELSSRAASISTICLFRTAYPKHAGRTRRLQCERAVARRRAQRRRAQQYDLCPPRRAAARSYRVGRAVRGVILRLDDETCAARDARGLAGGAVRAPPARAQDRAESARVARGRRRKHGKLCIGGRATGRGSPGRSIQTVCPPTLLSSSIRCACSFNKLSADENPSALASVARRARVASARASLPK